MKENFALEYWRAVKKGKDAVAMEKGKVRVKPEKLPIEVIHKSNTANYFMGVKQIGSSMLLVGIPADTKTGYRRKQDIQQRIARFSSTSKRSLKKKASLIKLKGKSTLGNAYLLSIFERGSPLRNQPGRQVLKPALFYKPNKETISAMLADAANEQLQGNEQEALSILNRCGDFAAKAAREWFTNPANNWAKNSPLTAKAKGSNKPGIWTGSMRGSITYIIRTAK